MPTRRQEILQLLERGEWTFDELRDKLELSVATLKSDLAHVERSLRNRAGRLEMSSPRCLACGFDLTPKPGRFTTPSRCPECREERIRPGRLTIG